MRSATKRKLGKDPEYLAFIHTLPCTLLCDRCEGLVEAHHAGDHGFSQKAPDRTALPLCAWHHRTGAFSAHVLGRRFWGFYKIDRQKLVAELNAQYEASRPSTD